MQFTCCTTIDIKETEPTKCRQKNYITLMETHDTQRNTHTKGKGKETHIYYVPS
jgi:hypothetical protein